MKTTGLNLAVFLLFVGAKAFAHEGHGIPGALPPGPHGGVVAESTTSGGDGHDHGAEHGHDHGKAAGHKHEHESEAKEHGHGSGKAHVEGKEYFYEAVYKDKKISVYPLTFGANTTTFVTVPKAALKNVNLKVEIPRQKKFVPIAPTLPGDAIEGAYDSGKANRFLIHVSAEIDGKTRTAKLQIERNK